MVTLYVLQCWENIVYKKLKNVNFEYKFTDKSLENFEFIKMDLCDGPSIKGLLTDYSFDYIVHMGAQAGVRYSLENPQGYIDSNIQGFFNLLEASKRALPL